MSWPRPRARPRVAVRSDRHRLPPRPRRDRAAGGRHAGERRDHRSRQPDGRPVSGDRGVLERQDRRPGGAEHPPAAGVVPAAREARRVHAQRGDHPAWRRAHRTPPGPRPARAGLEVPRHGLLRRDAGARPARGRAGGRQADIRRVQRLDPRPRAPQHGRARRGHRRHQHRHVRARHGAGGRRARLQFADLRRRLRHLHRAGAPRTPCSCTPEYSAGWRPRTTCWPSSHRRSLSATLLPPVPLTSCRGVRTGDVS